VVHRLVQEIGFNFTQTGGKKGKIRDFCNNGHEKNSCQQAGLTARRWGNKKRGKKKRAQEPNWKLAMKGEERKTDLKKSNHCPFHIVSRA